MTLSSFAIIFLCSMPNCETHSSVEENFLASFLTFARQVANIPSVHFGYTVKYQSVERHETRHYIGHFDYDAIYLKIYNELTTIADNTIQFKDIRSWNGRYGYAKGVGPDARTVYLNRYPLIPPGIAEAHMGSDYVLFPVMHSMLSFLETRRIVVDQLSTNPDKFRLIVADCPIDKSVPYSWYVFVVSTGNEGSRLRIVEELQYFSAIPLNAMGRPLATAPISVPLGLELPSRFPARFLHWRKQFTDYKVLDGIEFPVKWQLFIYYTGDTAYINADPREINIGLDCSHAYTVPMAATDDVFNVDERLIYKADEKEYDFKADGLVNESGLNTILERTNGIFVKPKSNSEHTFVPDGCGADSLYIVLSMLGKPCPLPKILDALDLHPGNTATSLDKVVGVLDNMQLKNAVIEGGICSFRSIFKSNSSIPLIMHLKKDPVGHFLCVRDYNADNDTVQIIDPPSDPIRASLESIMEGSTRIALIVDPQQLDVAGDLVVNSQSQSQIGYILVAAGTGGLLAAMAWVARNFWTTRS